MNEKLCPDCNGCGSVTESRRIDKGDYSEVPCEYCYGEGVVGMGYSN
tara:strand:+ start:374 stop:514 length:141 start_codon:yes stop_codon:yes gene_type:complete